MDEYSRYIPYHEVIWSMEGEAVALAAKTALGSLPLEVSPQIQTDNGSGYISREFKIVLSQRGVGHHRIQPHCPEENGLVERSHRTLLERLGDGTFRTFTRPGRWWPKLYVGTMRSACTVESTISIPVMSTWEKGNRFSKSGCRNSRTPESIAEKST